MNKLYLAYGSNLNVEQMAHRCPGARIVGKGVLKDWKLVFRYHATIEPCKGSSVPFAIWEITPTDEMYLDRYEGFPRYYVKKTLPVSYIDWSNGYVKKARAMAYIMTGGNDVQAPSGGYYKTIAEGYEWFGLDHNALLGAVLDANLGVEV